MRLLVLGASGGVGREVVAQAVARGHEVRALVRPGTVYEAPDGVEVIREELLEPGVLARVVEGVDAVLSAVGIRRRVQVNPFSPLISPPDLVQRMVAELAPAMTAAAVSRLILVSAAGAGSTRSALTLATRLMVDATRVGVAYRDLGAAEELLRETDLATLLVCPVTLRDASGRGRTRLTQRFGLTATISRAEVAAWMLDALDREPVIGVRCEVIRG